MTKAERLFKKNYYACMNHIMNFGYTEGVGFNTLECDDDDLLPTRTLNDVQKQIDRQRRQIETWKRLHIREDDNYDLEEQTLAMLQITLDNQRKVNAKWDDFMKSDVDTDNLTFM